MIDTLQQIFLGKVSKHKGRLDAIIEVKDYVYIMKFKLGDAAAALQQIKAQNYAQSYQNTSKTILLLGIAFDQKARKVKEIKCGSESKV